MHCRWQQQCLCLRDNQKRISEYSRSESELWIKRPDSAKIHGLSTSIWLLMGAGKRAVSEKFHVKFYFDKHHTMYKLFKSYTVGSIFYLWQSYCWLECYVKCKGMPLQLYILKSLPTTRKYTEFLLHYVGLSQTSCIKAALVLLQAFFSPDKIRQAFLQNLRLPE